MCDKYTKTPDWLIYSAVYHKVFAAGALEARVRRTSAFRAPARKTEELLLELQQVLLGLISSSPTIPVEASTKPHVGLGQPSVVYCGPTINWIRQSGSPFPQSMP